MEIMDISDYVYTIQETCFQELNKSWTLRKRVTQYGAIQSQDIALCIWCWKKIKILKTCFFFLVNIRPLSQQSLISEGFTL